MVKLCYVYAQNMMSQLKYLTSAVSVVQSFLTQSPGKVIANGYTYSYTLIFFCYFYRFDNVILGTSHRLHIVEMIKMKK